MTATLLSLCSGYGGLDLAVEEVFDARTVAFRRGDTGRRDQAPADTPLVGRPARGTEPDGRRPSTVPPTAWGDYAPAVERWEHVLGRPAPAPTDDRGRLSPAFVEWMMGLPQGWVTDTPGLSRSQMLKALGNGVVPQQAAYALGGIA